MIQSSGVFEIQSKSLENNLVIDGVEEDNDDETDDEVVDDKDSDFDVSMHQEDNDDGYDVEYLENEVMFLLFYFF